MAPLPDVRLSYGPLLLGVFFNMILYGVFLAQLLTYNRLFCHPQNAASPDGTLMKGFIVYLMVLETANTALDMGMLYQPLILEYGQVPSKFPAVFVTQPILVVLVSTPIQIFFAWRIWKITNCVSPPVLIVALACTSLAGGLLTAARVCAIEYFYKKPLLHTSALIWFVSSSCADVLITICLVLVLSNRKTGFSETDNVIDKLIRTTIQTGFVTACFSILDVCFFETLPHYSVNFIFDLPLSKLYSNALLSTLNARPRLSVSVVSHERESRQVTSRSVAYPTDEDGDVSSEGRWHWIWPFNNNNSVITATERRDVGTVTTSHQLVFEDMRALGFGASLDGDADMHSSERGAKSEEGEEKELAAAETPRSASSVTAVPSEISEMPRIPTHLRQPER